MNPIIEIVKRLTPMEVDAGMADAVLSYLKEEYKNCKWLSFSIEKPEYDYHDHKILATAKKINGMEDFDRINILPDITYNIGYFVAKYVIRLKLGL